jgi:L-alanine-DL-glutamate epimerase-like enolase superfamily enzyme
MASGIDRVDSRTTRLGHPADHDLCADRIAARQDCSVRVGIQRIPADGAAADHNSAGGMTEPRKIVTLASTYAYPVVPHANDSSRNAVHLFSATERTCPLDEWGEKINRNVQYFYRDWYEPKGNYYELPARPALDMDNVRNRGDAVR